MDDTNSIVFRGSFYLFILTTNAINHNTIYMQY